MNIRKSYIDGPHGQLHLRSCGGANAAPALICLHPAPFSGLAFTAMLPHLARDRMAIAPDFPGHGGSDPYRVDPSIADYAAAMLAVADSLSPDAPVDLFGFHTGCLVAAELSLIAPARVRRLVLCDVPAFDAQTRASLIASNAAPPGFTTELASLAPAWDRGITRRIESQGMARSFEMFVEQLRHAEAMNAGFHAGFTYPVEERLPDLAHPVTVIASQSGLLEATRCGAELIPGAKLVERLDIKRSVLDEAAAETSVQVLRALGT